MPKFDHERLEVNHVAVDLLALSDELVTALPSGRSYLGDQLHRAATSIVLNIAEGAGEFSRREKARFYRMALRSASECAAIGDICGRLRLAEEARLVASRELLLRIVSMLVPLVRKLLNSGTGTGTGTGKATGTGKEVTEP